MKFLKEKLTQIRLFIFDYKTLGGGNKRSTMWPKVRRWHLKQHPRCEVCDGKKKVEVHHVVPFSVDPTLELDKDNLISLCRTRKNGLVCHQLVGHLGNYRSYNEDVREDAKRLFLKIIHRP